ncbi:MAG: hypothetical protein IT374_10510 [Polyangiaceae bacterium]|nr:hypothetical protein [Polyangiaceae bacterium]
MKLWLTALAVPFVGLAPTDACAQAPQAVTAPPPQRYAPPPGQVAPISPPPPPAETRGAQPPTVRAGRRTHGGFFFQLASGLGLDRVTLELQGRSIEGQARSGAVDLAFGGTVARGLVVAGVTGFRASTMDLDRDGQRFSSNVLVTSSLMGVMLAWYPDPAGGFFAQVGGGYAAVSLDSSTLTVAQTPGRAYDDYPGDTTRLDGVGGFVGLGHGLYFSDEWSFGLTLRVDAATVSSHGAITVSATTLSPSLRTTLTFH